jgi:RNA polymerase sigma factor for flagellar operon FliA
MTGLLDALQRYVPQQNQSFEAYASMRIRGAIYDACRKEDILPRNQRDQLDLLEKVTRRLEHTLGRLPTELEIAKEAGVSIEDYFVVIDTFVNVMPIDDVPENLLPTDFSADPLEKVSGQQFLGQVVDILKTLPEKQRLVMALHYQEDLSYREIAAVLDLTPGRISQLHTQAMISIRALLNVEVG